METKSSGGHAAGFAGRVKGWALTHKFWSAVIIVVVLGGGYYTYGVLTAPSTATRYITTTVATSTVVESMSETGQVSATSNISVVTQSSGEVLSLPVSAGQHVDAGDIIAVLDPTTAQQSVADAEASLKSAQLSLAKLQEAAATSTLTEDQNSVASAQANLTQAHQSGYNDISSAFLDLPNVVAGLDTILHGSTVPGRTYEENENAYADLVDQYDTTASQYETNAESAFQTADTAYDAALAAFNSTPRDADDATIEALITQTYQASAQLSDALKAASDYLNFVDTTLTTRKLNIPSTLAPQITSLSTYTNQVNGNVVTLSSDDSAVTSGARALAAAQATLDQLQAGPDPLDVQSSELSIQQQENALAVAETNLANTVVRAPFSGIVASIAIQKYQTVGNGATVATMVSDNQTVALSLNEVDAAKIAVGQKATLTFDALPDVTIAGTVSSVSALGTVSSGVVSYNATVTFDTPNSSVLPGMSATADIITSTGTGLVVPATAVKTTGGQTYVQVFNPPLAGSSSAAGATSPVAPMNVPIIAGLTDDTNTLITSGLTAGEQVVTSTIAGTQATATKTAAAQSTSAFGGGTARAGGGGGVRIP